MVKSEKVVAIVQARMGSKRLPGKVMADIAGRPLIDYVLARAIMASEVDEVWLATSEAPENDALARHAEKIGATVFRGSESDVLSRYVTIARNTGADTLVRLTADCPLIDPDVVDLVIRRRRESGADYATNAFKRTFPDGLDVEVFTREALFEADAAAANPILREHVTLYIHGHWRDQLPAGDFKLEHVTDSADFSHLRWCVDEPADLNFIRAIVPELPENFRWIDVIALLSRKPDLVRLNRHITLQGIDRDLESAHIRNELRTYENSERYLQRALQTIPLGTQTFSKSHLQFVRGGAPQILVEGNGCSVVDVDGNRYIDFVLGLLPVVLGYRDPEVDNAILEQLERGISFSLPTALEAELAERLVRIIPCAEKVRFGKNGSDATTAAIRLARAWTGRDRVIACGYHGWHDWYIASTVRNRGIPDAVRALTDTVPYNDPDAVEAMFRSAPNEYAALILEPAGAFDPAPGYLERLREITERYGVVLVFDEIVTGFRINIGGAQAEYGVVPDLACFGKAMGNGMPISAVLGRTDIMDLMTEVFVSGTFGGEALSLAASIATVDKLERENVAARIRSTGARFIDIVNDGLVRHGLESHLEIRGPDWWPHFGIRDQSLPPNLAMSLLRQEFAEAGLLVLSTLNLSLAHDNPSVVAEVSDRMDEAFASLADAFSAGEPAGRLRGEMIKPVFSVRKA